MTSKKRNIVIVVQLLVVIGILVFANLILNRFARRIDLTEDHRHTPTEATQTLLDTLDAPILVKCYLYGDMPAKYQDMRDQIETFFGELKFGAGDNLEYEFIDPNGNDELYDRFIKAGNYPFKVVDASNTEKTEKIILPYATVTYRGEEQIVNLIKGCVYRTRNGVLEIATSKVVQDLEYNLVTVIYNMTRQKTKFVGLLSGHGEYGGEECGDLLNDLDDNYNILPVDISTGEAITPSCDVLLIMQPDSAFTEREKYELDQYLMRGGTILWFIDNQDINFDIGQQERTLTQLRSLNLDDMFLKWGVRLNYDIVQDQRCDWIPVALPNPSFGSQIQEVPWIFHPTVGLFPKHPVCRNMDQVLMRFPASIDTLARPGIFYEPFLYSGERSRTVQGNQFIDVDEYVRQPVPDNLFNKGPQIMGLAVKGILPSLFAGRQAPVDSMAPLAPTAQFLPRNVDTLRAKMIFIADGEFPTGALYQGKVGNLPYDNKALVMNCVDYLSGDEVLTKVRSQAITERKLDPEKVKGSKFWIYLINLGLPLLLIAGIGIVWVLLRKRLNK